MNGSEIKKAAINKAKQVVAPVSGSAKARKGANALSIDTTTAHPGDENPSPSSYEGYVDLPSCVQFFPPHPCPVALPAPLARLDA